LLIGARDHAMRTACYDFGFAPALRVPIVQRPRTWPFQGQNTGSNPVGDAIDVLLSLTELRAETSLIAPSNRRLFRLPFPWNATRPSGSAVNTRRPTMSLRR